MGQAAEQIGMSSRDFLDWDATQVQRHEFVGGEVFAMPGAGQAHATAAYDRGDTFAAYRKLPSLRELLLVDTDSRRCDLYRKGDDGLWVLHPFEPGQAVNLASVALEIGADALWAEVPGPQR